MFLKTERLSHFLQYGLTIKFFLFLKQVKKQVSLPGNLSAYLIY